MIECVQEESGTMSAILQQPATLRHDLCEGKSRGNHQIDRFGYAKRCLGLVKGVCPYLDNPAVVKEVIGDLSSTPFRVLRTQSHVPGKLQIRWLSKTPGYLFIAVPTSRPPTWLGSRCVSTSNKIKLSRSDTKNNDDDLEMSLWRLRRVCSKKEVVSIPAADVENGSLDSVTSWNYFVVATFQNRYPLYQDGRFLEKYFIPSIIKTKIKSEEVTPGKEQILNTLISNDEDDDLNTYINDSLKSTSSLRENARRLMVKREKIQQRFLLSERVGEGLFGSEDIKMFTRAAAHEQAEKWIDEGTISREEFNSVPWNDNSNAWRDGWLRLKTERRNRQPDLHILKRLGTVKATNRSSAAIKKLIFKLDEKNPKLGLTCGKDTLVITRVSNHAKQSGAKVGQQILEVQDTRVSTFDDLRRQLQKSIQEKRDRFIVFVCETNESKAMATKINKKSKKSTTPKNRKEKSQHEREKNMRRIGALLYGEKKTKTPSKIAMIGRAFCGDDIVGSDHVDRDVRHGRSDRTILGLQNSNEAEQVEENEIVIRACENRIRYIIREFGAENISYMPMKSYLINKFDMAQFERVKDRIKTICRSSARDRTLSGSSLPRDNVVVVNSDEEDASSSSSSTSSFLEIVASSASSSSSSQEEEQKSDRIGKSHRETYAVPMLGLTRNNNTTTTITTVTAATSDGGSSSYDSSDIDMFAALIVSDSSDEDEEENESHVIVASSSSSSSSGSDIDEK